MNQPPRVLAIAGSDPSGGAGIQADIKTITMLGGYAMTAITALTVQNTVGVTQVQPIAPDFVVAQIDACLDDIGVDAIKIGMLGSPEVVHAVADRLEKLDQVPVIFDPVMLATSGGELADAATVGAFKRLIAIATLTTPNLPELAALGGEGALMANAANLLIKGGHARSSEVVDRLIVAANESLFTNPRIQTRHTHGTGCTLASAIATNLGRGMSLAAAVEAAIAFVRAALKAAPEFGHGNGPLGHSAVR